jgi:hypothetical protein
MIFMVHAGTIIHGNYDLYLVVNEYQEYLLGVKVTGA